MKAYYTSVRNGPGAYTLTHEGLSMTIIRNPDLDAGQWIAYANWDKHIVIDPVYTKREAMQQARSILCDTAHDRRMSGIELY